ncbi:MAG: hypothetical protein PUP91_25585 [Rhizonema sp. PD37]|nr:hypothetical protein [Rhizonema sp. PD37]
MSIWRKYIIIAPVCLSITFMVTACNQSKISQCQQLIAVVNKGSELIDNNKGKKVTTSLQLVKDLEATTKDIKELDIKDPKLKEFQNSYANVFETFTQAISKAAQALNSTNTVNQEARHASEQIQKDRENIDASLTQVGATAGKQSDTLASQLNQYCRQPE